MPRLFLAATSLLLALPALAKDRPTLAVVGVHEGTLSATAQEELVAQVVDALDKTGKVDALNQDEVAFAVQGREAIILKDAFFGPGLRLLEDGRVMSDQAQFDDAVPLLEEAVITLQNGMATATSPKELWEAWMHLARAHLETGGEDNARAAVASAVALNPDRRPNPAQFPPNVVELYEEVATTRKAAMGKLQVIADAADVRVFVDGVERGTAPVTVEVVPGDHHVVARGADGSHAYRLANIMGGDSAEIGMKMSTATLGEPGASKFARSRQIGGVYQALGEQAEVDLVLLAGLTEGLLMVQLYSPRTDAFSRALELSYEGDVGDELLGSLGDLMQAVTDEGTIAAIATVPTAAPLDVGANHLLAQMLLNPKEELMLPTRSGLRWWHVAAGTVGAAGIAGGTSWFLLQRRENIPPHQGTITVVVP